jgi:GNAT superfamily N-acetyltransferase
MPSIRLFEPPDLEACYAISLATGLEGGDASHLYRDPKMMGHIYVAPYALQEPALALVVEDGDGVAGFAVGTTDTASWEARLERAWWPALRARYADSADIAPADRTPDQRRAFLIHHPAKTPAAVAEKYPAHLHMNLLPRVQRRGVGSTLLETWLERAASVGAHDLHVGVNRGNGGAIRFWASRRFKALTVPSHVDERTLWMGRAYCEATNKPLSHALFSASIQTN